MTKLRTLMTLAVIFAGCSFMTGCGILGGGCCNTCDTCDTCATPAPAPAPAPCAPAVSSPCDPCGGAVTMPAPMYSAPTYSAPVMGAPVMSAPAAPAMSCGANGRNCG